jgi:HPt (histidine-containing phosphotransfer) domain-containing protein
MTEELMPAEPSFDRSALDALADMAGDQARVFVDQLIQTYQGSAAKHLVVLKGAVEARDAKLVKEAAHALKGSAANLGLRRTVQIAAWMEDKGRNASLDPVPPVLPELEAEYERTRGVLADYLAQVK